MLNDPPEQSSENDTTSPLFKNVRMNQITSRRSIIKRTAIFGLVSIFATSCSGSGSGSGGGSGSNGGGSGGGSGSGGSGGK
jgi:hypothetical protein